MALFHAHMSYISKGTSPGGATGFATYLARESPDNATQFKRYLDRENGQPKEDLVASGHAHLPGWAKDNAHTFWLMADRHERARGVIARHLQVTLPRELSPQGRLDLAQDIRETLVARYPHSWAVHNPIGKDGQEQPHIHIIFSPRRDDGEISRSPREWFRQAARPGRDPATGGVRKDDSWSRKGRLYDVRWGVATLTNAALEREGIAAAVSHHSLEAQGLSRDPARYQGTRDRPEVQTYRTRLHQSGEVAWENELARAAWSQQQQREGIHDLSRQGVIDHVRDHVWRFDHSPSRDLERHQSCARSLAQPQQPQAPAMDLGGGVTAVLQKASTTMGAGASQGNGQGFRMQQGRKEPDKEFTW